VMYMWCGAFLLYDSIQGALMILIDWAWRKVSSRLKQAAREKAGRCDNLSLEKDWAQVSGV
jgi:hypothetical protein